MKISSGFPSDFTCNAGEFLNIKSQLCDPCPSGTYSVGDGVRFDHWSALPPGFTYSAESLTFSDFGYEVKVKDCSRSTWKPFGSYIASNTDDCASRLSYFAELKTNGSIYFEYQHTDADLLFHFYVSFYALILGGVL